MDSNEINNLREREKELNCLYRIMQILKDEQRSVADILKEVVDEIPPGWRYPGITMAKLVYQNRTFTSSYFFETRWYHSADIVVDEKVMGEIRVYYTENVTNDFETLFLPEEHYLLNRIAEQVSMFIFHRRLKNTLDYLDEGSPDKEKPELLPRDSDSHWKWRYRMARVIAEHADIKQFNIKAIYIIGSTQEAKAGPASDLDLLVQTDANARERELIRTWLDGWSRSLAEINYERTGFRLKDGLIDIHFVTTEEIRNKKGSYASMIGSTDDAAELIKKYTD
jgi:hypothetical protein